MRSRELISDRLLLEIYENFEQLGEEYYSEEASRQISEEYYNKSPGLYLQEKLPLQEKLYCQMEESLKNCRLNPKTEKDKEVILTILHIFFFSFIKESGNPYGMESIVKKFGRKPVCGRDVLTSEERERKDSNIVSFFSPLKVNEILNFIIVGTLTGCFGIVSAWYILDQILDSKERFSHNEDYTKASITLLTALFTGITATALARVFLTTFIAQLVVDAGFSNGVMVVLGVFSIGMTVSAAITYLANQLLLLCKNDPEALDPRDPIRFGLSDKEYLNLLEKNIDPLVVKCAMVSLRSKMGSGALHGPLNPDFLFFSGGRASEQRKNLEKIRQLRREELEAVKVGEWYFDLKLTGEGRSHYNAWEESNKNNINESNKSDNNQSRDYYAPSLI